MILHAQATKPVAHLVGDSTETYLHKCRQNIAAEVWSLLCNSRQPVDVVTSGGNSLVSVHHQRGGVRVPNDQLWYNVLLIRGCVCLVTGRRRCEALCLDKGRLLSHRAAGAFLVGYVKPYIYEYAAIANYLDGGVAVPPVLQDIAQLGVRRTAYTYEQRPFSGSIASNALQRQSVTGLAHTVEGIQGPPGTGKSSTIFHIVNSAVPAGVVAVVTCVQNRAVDALACKFRVGCSFVVLGSPDRLGDTAKEFALERRVETVAPVARQRSVLEWTVRVLEFLHSALRKRQASGVNRFRSYGWRRWWVLHCAQRPSTMADLERWSARCDAEERELGELRQSAAQALALEAAVFLCTVDALSRVAKLAPKRRMVLIIDEAGTVPEFKLPLAASLGAVEAVVAVGDQNQLQPFTHTGRANGFFHRLAAHTRTTMLEEQFRMHPDLCSFVSSSFYGGRLFTNPDVAVARCSVPRSGVWWVDYAAEEHAETSRAGAVCNRSEVQLLGVFMRQDMPGLLAEGKTVMLITFYREQFHLLMQLAERLGLVRTVVQGTKTERSFVHPGLRISTVDASQGSEADVVVLCCVRCNPRHEIGFLAHPNRACVALSRARERLVVVGCSQTLIAKNPVWGALYLAARKEDSLCHKPSTALGEGGGGGVQLEPSAGL